MDIHCLRSLSLVPETAWSHQLLPPCTIFPPPNKRCKFCLNGPPRPQSNCGALFPIPHSPNSSWTKPKTQNTTRSPSLASDPLSCTRSSLFHPSSPSSSFFLHSITNLAYISTQQEDFLPTTFIWKYSHSLSLNVQPGWLAAFSLTANLQEKDRIKLIHCIPQYVQKEQELVAHRRAIEWIIPCFRAVVVANKLCKDMLANIQPSDRSQLAKASTAQ